MKCIGALAKDQIVRPSNHKLSCAIILLAAIAVSCFGSDNDPPPADAGSTDSAVGTSTDGGAVDAGPVTTSTFTAAIRFANFVPGGQQIDACLSLTPDGAFEGPVIQQSGGDAVPFGVAAARIEVLLTPTSVLRWVDGLAMDCSAPLVGTNDTEIGIMEAGPFTMALIDADGVSATDEVTTRRYSDRTVDEPLSGRFYSRFLHLGVELPNQSVKQSTCAIPFAAFENTSYGELGFSPNNQASFFSASVTIGETFFQSDIVLCSGTSSTTLSLPNYRFNGGEIQLLILAGDGSAEFPYRMTRCIDTEVSPEPCVSLE